MQGPKHNRLGCATELIVVWVVLGAVVIWLIAGTPGI